MSEAFQPSCDTRDFLSALHRGATTLGEMVGKTMGPHGSPIMLERQYGAPTLTKDGVTVAKAVAAAVADRLEAMGAEGILQAAVRGRGDGTTTTSVMAAAMFDRAVPMIAQGAHGALIAREMVEHVVLIKAALESRVTRDFELIDIARLATNGDEELARCVVEITEKIGPHGVPKHRGSINGQTGVEFDCGWQISASLPPDFVLGKSVTLTDAVVIIYAGAWDDLTRPVVQTITECAQAGIPVLLVGRAGCSPRVKKSCLDACARKQIVIPLEVKGDDRLYVDETLTDLAAASGAEVIRVGGLGKFQPRQKGVIGAIEISDRHTVLTSWPNDLSERIEAASKLAETLDRVEAKAHKARAARMAGVMGTLTVAAATEAMVAERVARAEDALHACHHVLGESDWTVASGPGAVPGGGWALFTLARELFSGDTPAAQVLRAGLEAPLRTLLRNARVDLSTIETQAYSAGGFDVRRRQPVDVVEAKILDPLTVVVAAMEAAVSAAAGLISTAGVVPFVQPS